MKRLKVKKDLKIEALSESQALPFKGCISIDSTLKEEKVNTKRYTRIAKGEHLFLSNEPRSHYIAHLNLSFGTAKHISIFIIAYFEGITRDLSQLLAIGCDGRSINTRWKSSVNLELKLGKPLQWVIYHLHFNE